MLSRTIFWVQNKNLFLCVIFSHYWPTDTSKHKCRKPNGLNNLPYCPTNKTGKIVWGHCVLSILKLLKPKKRKQQKHVFQPYKCLSVTVLTFFGITVTIIFEFSLTVDFPQAFHLCIHHIQKQVNRKSWPCNKNLNRNFQPIICRCIFPLIWHGLKCKNIFPINFDFILVKTVVLILVSFSFSILQI